jgi:hypothetical protein
VRGIFGTLYFWRRRNWLCYRDAFRRGHTLAMVEKIMSELQRAPLCYLATPYSKYKGGDLVQAFQDAAALTAKLMVAGIKCYSPIAHTHPVAIYGNLDPLDYKIWLPFDEAMMNAASVLIVAHMDGWHESFGIAHEVNFFEQRGKPIYDLNPETMTMTRRLRKLPARDRFEDKTASDLEPDRRAFLENNPLADKHA